MNKAKNQNKAPVKETSQTREKPDPKKSKPAKETSTARVKKAPVADKSPVRSQSAAKAEVKSVTRQPKASPKRSKNFAASNFILESEKLAERIEDQLKPTKPISAYIYFAVENIPKIKKELGVDQKAAMAEAGARWRKILPAERELYDKKHASDRSRYSQ